MSKKVAIERVLLVPGKYPNVAGLTTTYGYSSSGKAADIKYASETSFKGPYGVDSSTADGKKDALKFAVILKVAGAANPRIGFAVLNGHLTKDQCILGNYHAKPDADGKQGVSVWKDQAASGDGMYVEDGAFGANMQMNKAYNSGATQEDWFRGMRNQFAEAGKKYTVLGLDGSNIEDLKHITIDDDLKKGDKMTVADMASKISTAQATLDGIQVQADAATSKAEADAKKIKVKA